MASKRNCRAVHVDDIDGESVNPGEFKYVGFYSQPGMSGINFICPCGCGVLGYLRFGEPTRDPKNPRWKWDGNEATPTLTPSIKKTTECGWHGFLTNGFFKEC